MNWIDMVFHTADSALRAVMGMRDRLVVRRTPRHERIAYDRKDSRKSAAPALVQQRPPQMEDQWGVLEDTKHVDAIFTGLKKKLFEDSDELSAKARRGEDRGKTVFREAGKTSEGRGYLFFKPFNDYGWLVERSGAGWRISRAEKIISQQMFLRSNSDPWDVAVLFSDPKRSEFVRVKSRRFGDTLMSMAVYEQRLRSAFQNELIGDKI